MHEKLVADIGFRTIDVTISLESALITVSIAREISEWGRPLTRSDWRDLKVQVGELLEQAGDKALNHWTIAEMKRREQNAKAS